VSVKIRLAGTLSCFIALKITSGSNDGATWVNCNVEINKVAILEVAECGVELAPNHVVDREGANSVAAWVNSSEMEKDSISGGNLWCPHDPKFVLDIRSALLIFKRNLKEA